MQIFTPEKRVEFLDCLRETCNVSLAAKAGGISRRRAYQIRESEPDFAELWDDALQEGIDNLEHEAQRRGFRGVDEPVFYMGAPCGTIRKYSDTLAIFLLKAHRPDRFRDNSKVELSGMLDLQSTPDEDLQNEIATLTAQLAAAGVLAGQAGAGGVFGGSPDTDSQPDGEGRGGPSGDACDDLV